MSKTLWDANFYDGSHGYITRYGEDLLDWLAPLPHERICDAGCATGDLTSKIAKMGANVLGVDNAESMIIEAKKKYSTLRFKNSDITSLPFEGEFDGVFSNAVLHWIKDADTAISSIYRTLKPGGRFIAEMGGKNNIKTILTALYDGLERFGYGDNKANNPWAFFSVGEYTSKLEANGFTVRKVIYFARFTELDKGQDGLRNWLKMFANGFFQGIPLSVCEDIYVYIEKQVRSQLFKNGKWYADYKRLRVWADKAI